MMTHLTRLTHSSRTVIKTSDGSLEICFQRSNMRQTYGCACIKGYSLLLPAYEVDMLKLVHYVAHMASGRLAFDLKCLLVFSISDLLMPIQYGVSKLARSFLVFLPVSVAIK